MIVTLSGIDFPIATHPDESTKASFLLSSYPDYRHPLLIREIAWGGNLVAQASTMEAAIKLGRLCAALAGGLLVFATFQLSRLVLPDGAALAATAITAATPLVSVHARFFKEDIFLAAFIVLALAALIRLLKEPTASRAVMLGLLVGLAAGSKYVGGLLLPFAATAILFASPPAVTKQTRLKLALIVAGTATAMFLLIELPALLDFTRLSSGVGFEFHHMRRGHDVAIGMRLTYGVFHLRKSLGDGLGPALLIFGLLGLAAPLMAPMERRLPLIIIAAFAVIWYFAHEASPLKPYPDFVRYMVPLAPLLSVLATSFVTEIMRRQYQLGLAAAAGLLVAALLALSTSIRINGPAADDPRVAVPPILASSHMRVATDRYATYRWTPILGMSLAPPGREAADIVATANFTYDRFVEYGARVKRPAARQAAAYYKNLATLPHLDISNGRPSFGFFNPVIRLVALDGRVDQLQDLARAINTTAPNLTVDLIEPNVDKK